MGPIGPDDRMCPSCGAILVLERKPARPEEEAGWTLRHLASIMGRLGCAVMIAQCTLVLVCSAALVPQAIAFLSVVLALVSAWYAANFSLGGTFFNLLDGRYPLVFPALLVFLSFIILPSVRLQGANVRNLLVVVLLVASPVAIHELGKRNTVAGLGVGLILILAAALLLLRDKK